MGKLNKALCLTLILVLVATSISLLSSRVSAESSQSGLNDIYPPSVQFSIVDGTILYELGIISIGFAVGGSGSIDGNEIVISHLDSVSYMASWEASSIFVYQAAQGSNLNSFFYSVDLTNVSLGPKQVIVTATASGTNFGEGASHLPFSLTSSSTLTFNLQAAPLAKPTPPSNTSAWSLQTIDENGVGGVGAHNVCPIALDSNNEKKLRLFL